MYRYISGAYAMPFQAAAELSRHLVERFNDHRLARCFLPADAVIIRREIMTDGRTEDEILNISEAEGRIIQALRKGHHHAALALCEELIQQGAQLRAEVEGLER
jgi:hypothetical protein